VSFVFIITLFLLAAIAYTIYRKQQQHATVSDYELSPMRPRPLFDASVEDDRTSVPVDSIPAETDSRARLLARAALGDYTSLADARRTGDAAVYDSTLGELLRWAESSPECVQALAAFVLEHQELRGNVELSQAFSLLWEQSPDAASTARALHLAALSDDAVDFGRVVELAFRLRREERLATVSAKDLCALVESEFWMLSKEARASGAGFVFKQKLVALRAEFATREASGT
jgi:hypothetical protein